LGPALLESTCQACLAYELRQRGYGVEVATELPFVYKYVDLDCGYRIDLLVEETIIVELKSVDKVHPIHEAQLLSYLKLSNKTVGLLINKNVVVLVDGIQRIVNNYQHD
jgi:GxxExxY protein